MFWFVQFEKRRMDNQRPFGFVFSLKTTDYPILIWS
jgi:hypothetical protein